jgi:hypothetical protein
MQARGRQELRTTARIARRIDINSRGSSKHKKGLEDKWWWGQQEQYDTETEAGR